jgi:uncharacterized protein (TIGR02246 family)
MLPASLTFRRRESTEDRSKYAEIENCGISRSDRGSHGLCTCLARRSSIRQVLDDQVTAWNRGDVETFMHAYKDSPDTTFFGKSVAQGYRPILERYKKAYSSKDAMGTLAYSDLTVRQLGENYAVVTGKFHLARNAAGGGDTSGIFSLVWAKTPEGWKIILDHTSVATP